MLSMLKLVWLICDTNDGRRTTAVLANRKNSKSLSIAPAMWKNHLFLHLKKKCDNPLSGNSKGDHLHAFTHHVFIFHLTFTSSACEHLFKRQASWFSFDTQSQKH